MKRRAALPVSPPELEAVIEGDRRFFRRFPHRRYRIRHMALAERDALVRAGKVVETPPEGWRWYVAVHQIARGLRERQPFQSPEAAEVDLPEDLACGLYLAAIDGARTGLGYGVIEPGAIEARLARRPRR